MEENRKRDLLIAIVLSVVHIGVSIGLNMLQEEIPLDMLFSAINMAVLVVEAVFFTKKTGRTLMFPVTVGVSRLILSITLIIIAALMVTNGEFGDANALESIMLFSLFATIFTGPFFIIAVVTTILTVAVSCAEGFLIPWAVSLITKSNTDKKAESSDVPEIETTGEDLQ